MRTLTWLTGSVFCVSVLLWPIAAGAEESQTPQQTPQPGGPPQATGQEAPNEIDADAMDTLKRMADALARAKGFSVTMRSSYDVLQDTGEKIEFGERRTAVLKRPDGLRVEEQDSDGERTLVTFDGKALTVFKNEENVYGRIERAGTVDDAVHYLVQDLQVRLPMALLLVSTLPAELEKRIQALDYVERDTLTPVPTDHLAARTEDVDFQVWVAADGEPLPQRITITYKSDEGEPQYRADFSDWKLNPDIAPAQFAFQPPDGAERIPFLIRVRKATADQQTRNDGAGGGTSEGPGNAEGTAE